MQTHLLCLHGALGSAQQTKALTDHCRSIHPRFEVQHFNFSGHGGVKANGPYRIETFAGEVLSWMDEQGYDSIDIFGYSMGGYVGMWLAIHYPERVKSLFTLATKWQWDPETAAREVRMLNPDKIAEKVPAFAAFLKERHQPLDWKEVVRSTAEMMIHMGDHPPLSHAAISSSKTLTVIARGDKDNMISQEESKAMYALLPEALYLQMEDTPHAFEQMDLNRVSEAIIAFFLPEV